MSQRRCESTTKASSKGSSLRKEVRFASVPGIDIISTRLTKEEHQATWYNLQDFLEFKRLNRSIGKIIRERRSLFESFDERKLDPLTAEEFESHLDDDVTRGIEHFCCAVYFEERKLNKQRTVQAVLTEQRRQRYSNIYDPEAIAEVESRYSRWAKKLAYQFGLLNATIVKDNSETNTGEQGEEVSEWYTSRKNTCNLRRPLSPRSCADIDLGYDTCKEGKYKRSILLGVAL